MTPASSVFLQARFLTSAAKAEDLPPGSVPELAFAGRSNVGKSSAINALAGRKRLAFFSKTPGRTRMINFFALGELGRLADLPGYGYASAPKSMRADWDALLGAYLQLRRTVAGVVMLMDSRHPLTANDRNFLHWLRPVEARRLVLLSKSDKLSRTEAARTLSATKTALDHAAMSSDVMLFSSASGDGVEQARELLERWLREAAEDK